MLFVLDDGRLASIAVDGGRSCEELEAEIVGSALLIGVAVLLSVLSRSLLSDVVRGMLKEKLVSRRMPPRGRRCGHKPDLSSFVHVKIRYWKQRGGAQLGLIEVGSISHFLTLFSR